MKLLIITQKINQADDVLGFFHGWIEEFAHQVESVVALGLENGEHRLPQNVKVLSLGKEVRRSLIRYLINFYKYIWRERKNYDVVFVHMNQEYILLGWFWWRLWGKKITLWYAHGKVSFSLKLAAKLVDLAFTSTRSGFRIPSPKLEVVGQGIDLKRFNLAKLDNKIDDETIRLISIGRISPVKDYDTLLEAARLLAKDGIKFQLTIIGASGLDRDRDYFEKLKQISREEIFAGSINFVGAVANSEIKSYLDAAEIFVNMSYTGSLDKAILEAMACGLPILTCNEALNEVIGVSHPELLYGKSDSAQLAEKIKWLIKLDKAGRAKLGRELSEIVTNKHSLPRLVGKITSLIQTKLKIS